LPILSADTGEFYISVQPVPVEAKPFDPKFLPDNLENWSKVSKEPDTPQAVVSVEDINKYIKNYRYPVFLKSDESFNTKHNLIVRFETPTDEPPFKAKLFVYIINPEKSLDLLPLTIEGIGGDGKKCNCTIYINHRSPEDLAREGIIQARRGNYSESLRLFNKSIEINQSYALAWKNKGIVLSKYFKDKEENAISCLNKSLELNPEDHETWNIKAYILCKLGYYNESLLCSEMAIQKSQQKYAWAWNNKGIALMKIGHVQPFSYESRESYYVEAANSYDQALDLDKNYEDAWINKGIALDWIGFLQIGWMSENVSNMHLSPYEEGVARTYDESVRAFDKAIELNPKNAHAWFNKALALGHRGKMAEALQASNRSFELDAEYAQRPAIERESEALRFR